MPQPRPVRPRIGSTWVIGHRGYPLVAPENTLTSFARAFEAGADMIELDVALSKDGVVIVLHDSTVNRTTNGKGPVSRKTLSEIKHLDIDGEQIPTLVEALQFAKGKMAVNIEIKSEAVRRSVQGGIEEKVVQLIHDLDVRDHVVVSSFYSRAVQRVKEMDPLMPTAVLLARKPLRSPAKIVSKLKADAIHLHFRRLPRKFMDQALKENIPLRIYTVNKPAIMKKVLGWGIDGIFTDDPKTLVRVVRETMA